MKKSPVMSWHSSVCRQTCHASIAADALVMFPQLFPSWEVDRVKQVHLLPLSMVCELLALIVGFPTGLQQQVPGCWLSFSLLGAMVTSGEWERWAVNNWRGVCYGIGLLALTKVSWVPPQTLLCFWIRKWQLRVLMVSLKHAQSLTITALPCQEYSHSHIKPKDRTTSGRHDINISHL